MNAKILSNVRLGTSLDNRIPFLHSDVLEFKKIVDDLIEKTEQYSKQVEAIRLKVRSIDSQ